MEQTLGNRIVYQRKKLGLTQDQLAEKLGVTAQAVSKWENDQSCPDITMLPKLADIFGLSIDALLGRETHRPIHEAEVVDDKDADDSGIFNFSINPNDENKRWVFRWDSGRAGAVGFACWVLLMGALLLVKNLTQTDVSFWNIAWPSALVMLGLFGGDKFSFFRLGCILLGGWFLLDHVGLIPFDLGSEIIWPALIILFGLGLLADALRKPEKPRFSVIHNGKHIDTDGNEQFSSCEMTGNSFTCENNFGEKSYQIWADNLERGNIENNFGRSTVDLSGVKAVAAGCKLEAETNFGELKILVPRQYAIYQNPETTLGSVETVGEPDSTPNGIISMNCEANFGSIVIQYI